MINYSACLLEREAGQSSLISGLEISDTFPSGEGDVIYNNLNLMRKKMSLILAITACWMTISCNQTRKPVINENGRILKVPSEFATIAEAVNNSVDGDWIILAPGKYMEMKIDLDKSVTISSEWKLAGDELKIEETIIDSQDSILFNIKKDGVEISGLKDNKRGSPSQYHGPGNN